MNDYHPATYALRACKVKVGSETHTAEDLLTLIRDAMEEQDHGITVLVHDYLAHVILD